MVTSFLGKYSYTVDNKGRMNIPAKFRKAISPEADETFIITRGFNDNLMSWPLDEWKNIEARLKNLSMTQRNERIFLLMLTSNASYSQFDKQGRIIIPHNLLELAGIQKEVSIIGAIDHIEIWNPEKFEEYMKNSEVSYKEVAESVLF